MVDYRIFLNVFLSMEGPSERRHLRFSTWLGAETGLRKASFHWLRFSSRNPSL